MTQSASQWQRIKSPAGITGVLMIYVNAVMWGITGTGIYFCTRSTIQKMGTCIVELFNNSDDYDDDDEWMSN